MQFRDPGPVVASSLRSVRYSPGPSGGSLNTVDPLVSLLSNYYIEWGKIE